MEGRAVLGPGAAAGALKRSGVLVSIARSCGGCSYGSELRSGLGPSASRLRCGALRRAPRTRSARDTKGSAVPAMLRVTIAREPPRTCGQRTQPASG